MELSAYEGGSGGKFLRRPFRRSPLTPYDRPPSAARGLRGLRTAAGSGSGWLSKLVDPASRFIAGSTSRLFSTVFRKRLPAPTENHGSEQQNCEAKLCVSEAVDDVPSESQIQAAVDGHNQSMDFVTPGISEIEQLLKQKIYTRAQVDYLTGLICSRAFEPTVQQTESNNEKVNVSEEQKGERSTNLNRKLSTSETALTDVAASPAEIAKAYMNSRLPKASSSALSLQTHVFQKDKSSPFSGPSALKPHDLSVGPRSTSHFSEVHEPSSAGYPTPKYRGRSAMYRMSRSPYFKVNPSVNANVSEYARGSSADLASSQWSPGRTSNSESRQVLKRDRSFLDSEDGSSGPIRRTRQKSSLVSVSTRTRFTPLNSYRNSSSLNLDKDDLKNPTSSEGPHSLNELMNASKSIQHVENGDGKKFSSNLPPVPRQSSEACRRILEQLDKVAPSREEKSNSRRYIAMDELPSKLTTEMLNGRARKSMDNVDISQFTSLDVIDNSDHINVEGLRKFGGSQTEKPSNAHENDPSRVDAPQVKFETSTNGISKHDIFSKSSIPSTSLAGAVNPVSATVRSQRKPAFQMTAPEDLLELDDEKDTVDVSAHSTLSVIKTDSKIAETKASIFGKLAQENHDVSEVPEKESSFRFLVSTESRGFSPSDFTPTMPFPSHDKLDSQNEQITPKFMFGSQISGTQSPSSVTTVANECLVESKRDLSWADRKIQLEGSNLLGDGKSDAFSHKSPGIIASSGLQASGTTDAIAFGASSSSIQSNGLGHSSSLMSLSASKSEAILKSPVNLFSSNSKLAEASSSGSPMSMSSPVSSPATAFNFGAAASTAIPVSVTLSSVDSEGKFANKSPLGSSNPPSMQVAPTSLSMGQNNTSLVGSSPLPFPGSIPPATNSSSTAPSIFSQVSSYASGFAPPPSSSTQASISFSAASGSFQDSTTKFGSTGVSIFGIQPAQSSTGTSLFSQSSTSQPGSNSSSTTVGSTSSSWPSSSTFGLNGSSQPGFGQITFGATNQATKTFGSSSGFSFTSDPSSSSSGFSFSSGTVVSSSTSSPFPSIAGASNSSSGLSFSTGSSISNSGFTFSANASSTTSSSPNSVFGSLPQTGFSFGLTAPAPASSVSSFGFGSSSGSVFSFTSSGASMSASTASPIFGTQNASGGFSSVSPNSDQMNVEDTMADDTHQISGPVFPTFGQQGSTPASSSFVFGSTVPSGGTSVFQFGNQQNSSILPNTNPFQAGGNLDFAPGGSFSLGSGGGDKSTRKIVKVRRDKIRRK